MSPAMARYGMFAGVVVGVGLITLLIAMVINGGAAPSEDTPTDEATIRSHHAGDISFDAFMERVKTKEGKNPLRNGDEGAFFEAMKRMAYPNGDAIKQVSKSKDRQPTGGSKRKVATNKVIDKAVPEQKVPVKTVLKKRLTKEKQQVEKDKKEEKAREQEKKAEKEKKPEPTKDLQKAAKEHTATTINSHRQGGANSIGMPPLPCEIDAIPAKGEAACRLLFWQALDKCTSETASPEEAYQTSKCQDAQNTATLSCEASLDSCHPDKAASIARSIRGEILKDPNEAMPSVNPEEGSTEDANGSDQKDDDTYAPAPQTELGEEMDTTPGPDSLVSELKSLRQEFGIPEIDTVNLN